METNYIPTIIAILLFVSSSLCAPTPNSAPEIISTPSKSIIDEKSTAKPTESIPPVSVDEQKENKIEEARQKLSETKEKSAEIQQRKEDAANAENEEKHDSDWNSQLVGNKTLQQAPPAANATTPANQALAPAANATEPLKSNTTQSINITTTISNVQQNITSSSNITIALATSSRSSSTSSSTTTTSMPSSTAKAPAVDEYPPDENDDIEETPPLPPKEIPYEDSEESEPELEKPEPEKDNFAGNQQYRPPALEEPEDDGMIWFIILVTLTAAGIYVAYHNRKKIAGYILEGKNTRKTHNGRRYRQLSTNDNETNTIY